MALAATVERLRSYRAALMGRDFRLLFAGQTVSEFGDWINQVALIILVYQLTGRQAAVALVLVAQLLPRAIVLPFSGVLADRYPKRLLMLGTDLAQAALAASLLLVATAHDLWWVCAAVMFMQGLAAVFTPARSAAIPALVPREHLGAANAVNGLAGQAAFFAGPALGGLLVGLWGVDVVFAINAGTFLFSALLIWAMRLPEPPRDPGSCAGRAAVREDLREGWTVVAPNPALRMIFGGLFLGAATAVSLKVLLVALLTERLGRPAEDLGLLMTTVGLGTLGGTLLGLWLMARLTVVPIITVVVLALTLDMAIIGAARSFAVVAAALFVNGVLSMANELVAQTTLQRLVPTDRLGRVFGLLFWGLTLGQVVGALAGGALPRYLGTAGTVLGLGACYALALAVLFLFNADAAGDTGRVDEAPSRWSARRARRAFGGSPGVPRRPSRPRRRNRA